MNHAENKLLQYLSQYGTIFVKEKPGPGQREPIKFGWRENPESFKEIARHNGNIGLLTGVNGFVVIDIDDHYSIIKAEYPSILDTAVVKRKDAPERGGAILKVIEGACVLKRWPEIHAPGQDDFCVEILAVTNEGKGRKKTIAGLHYETRAELVWNGKPVAEVSVEKIDAFWQWAQDRFSLKRAVLDGFNFEAFAKSMGEIQWEGSEFRIKGHQGLMVNPQKKVWYRHSTEDGGDALSLIAFSLFGEGYKNALHDQTSFQKVLREGAAFAGIALGEKTAKKLAAPSYQNGNGKPYTNGHAPAREINRLTPVVPPVDDLPEYRPLEIPPSYLPLSESLDAKIKRAIGDADDPPFVSKVIDYCRRWRPNIAPEYARAAAIYALSSAVANRAQIMTNYETIPSLYFFVTGASGEGKSDASSLAVEFLREAGLGGLATAGKFSDWKIIFNMIRSITEIPALKWDKMSPEKQAEKIFDWVFTHAGKTKAFVFDEGEGILAQMAAPQDKVSDFNSFFMNGFYGFSTAFQLDTLSNLQRGIDFLDTPRLNGGAYLTFWANIPRVTIGKMKKERLEKLFGNGPLSRMIVVDPPAAPDSAPILPLFKRERREKPNDIAFELRQINRYLMQGLPEYPTRSGQPCLIKGFDEVDEAGNYQIEIPKLPVKNIEVDEAAQELLNEYHIHARTAAKIAPPILDAPHNRCAELALRTAGLFAIWEAAMDVNPSIVIDATHAARAIRFIETDRIAKHRIAALLEKANDKMSREDDDRILSLIDKMGGACEKRELYRKLNIKAKVLDELIKPLISQGLLVLEKRRNPKGKPSEVYARPEE